MPKLNSERTPDSIDATDSLPRISRRRFAGKAAAVAATPLSLVSRLLGASCGSTETTAGQSQQETALDLTADQVRDADAKLANAIRQFGDRLSEEQRGRLRRILLYNEKMLASIRTFHVENGDAPASVLIYFDDGIETPERPPSHPSPHASPGVGKQG